MNEMKASSLSASVGAMHGLAATLGTDDTTLGGLAFELLDRIGALVMVKEVASGRCVASNAAMARLFGREPGALAGVLDSDLLEPAQVAALRVAEHAALAQAVPSFGEQRVERDGVRHEFHVTRIAVPRSDGASARHLMSVWVDMTATHRLESQLQQALKQIEQQQGAVEAQVREAHDSGLRDGVTGLYQRLHFDDQLRREVDLSSREHREFALVSIALDPLGDAVVALGAEARTRIFEALGRLLRGNTRAMDASCRLEEERFAVLLSGVGLATAHSRMEGLRRQCATQIVVLDGRDLGFTVSMGVASFPHTAHTEQELMDAADTALAEARKRGGNHVTLASIRFEPG